jgi:hypothetical protein
MSDAEEKQGQCRHVRHLIVHAYVRAELLAIRTSTVQVYKYTRFDYCTRGIAGDTYLPARFREEKKAPAGGWVGGRTYGSTPYRAHQTLLAACPRCGRRQTEFRLLLRPVDSEPEFLSLSRARARVHACLCRNSPYNLVNDWYTYFKCLAPCSWALRPHPIG